MKNFLASVFGPIISLLKDSPSDKRYSMGRVSWVILFTCDLIIWFGGKEIPEGMLTITTYLLLYITGTKALGKIKDVSSLIKSMKELKEANKGTSNDKIQEQKITKKEDEES